MSELLVVDISESAAEFGLDVENPTPNSRTRVPASLRKQILECAKVVEAARHGDRRGRAAFVNLMEAQTTADLMRYASGVVLDREMLQNYESMPAQWPKFCRSTTVRNFQKKYLSRTHLGTQTLDLVPEATEYPKASPPSLDEYPIQVSKYGKRYGWTWEARVDEDVDQLMVVPGAFPQMAVNTEDVKAISLLADPVTGAPNTAFFKVADGIDNIGTGDLNEANLDFVVNRLSAEQVDPFTGRLIRPGKLLLVVGPRLQTIAERILGWTTRERTVGSTKYTETNDLRGRVELVVLDNLPGVAWFVFEDPKTARQPAFWLAKLVGYETPDLRYQNDQGLRLGGGSLPADEGSFRDDTIWYRCRHVFGVSHGFRQFTFASDGITGTTTG